MRESERKKKLHLEIEGGYLSLSLVFVSSCGGKPRMSTLWVQLGMKGMCVWGCLVDEVRGECVACIRGSDVDFFTSLLIYLFRECVVHCLRDHNRDHPSWREDVSVFESVSLHQTTTNVQSLAERDILILDISVQCMGFPLHVRVMLEGESMRTIAEDMPRVFPLARVLPRMSKQTLPQ